MTFAGSWQESIEAEIPKHLILQSRVKDLAYILLLPMSQSNNMIISKTS